MIGRLRAEVVGGTRRQTRGRPERSGDLFSFLLDHGALPEQEASLSMLGGGAVSSHLLQSMGVSESVFSCSQVPQTAH